MAELKSCMLQVLEVWLNGASIPPGNAIGELQLYLIDCNSAKQYNAEAGS